GLDEDSRGARVGQRSGGSRSEDRQAHEDSLLAQAGGPDAGPGTVPDEAHLRRESCRAGDTLAGPEPLEEDRGGGEGHARSPELAIQEYDASLAVAPA